jgi:hypothetical protein
VNNSIVVGCLLSSMDRVEVVVVDAAAIVIVVVVDDVEVDDDDLDHL